MSADFLLELRSEEIPARMQAKARMDLARLFAEALGGAGLQHGAIQTFSTPRRLALIAREVAGETEAVSEELKGPRTSAPPQALEGFLRKTGLSQDQLEDRDGVWFAVIDMPGQSASAVIADAIRSIIADFPWPKSMRWGDGELRWVRPLHGMVALLGEEIVPIEVAGIKSGAATLGHRFHHPGPITIGGAHDYAEKMRACHVIVDQDEREAIIRSGAARAALDMGLSLIEDEGLVVENAGLTEWPVPLLGQFDPDFLDVPREVIVLTMRTNQKYFACARDDGALAPAFVCTANIEAADGGAAIVEGNRKVLAARLADARFFWEQDLKVPLEEQARKLDQIVFHEKLGTVADKVERVAKLARWLVEEGIVRSSPGRGGGARSATEGAAHVALPLHHSADGPPPRAGEDLADQAERAARLAKADLVTGMVGEFPELQGVIGGYLAAAQGEPKAVADALRDHYKPVGQGDEVPTAPVTVAVSLADKLDTIAAFFAIKETPTGSRDPFGIRRAAIGVLRLIENNGLRLGVTNTVIEAAHRLPIEPVSIGTLNEFERKFVEGFGDEVAADERAISGLLISLSMATFIGNRLFAALRLEGKRSDFVEASFGSFSNDFLSLRHRASALESFIGTSAGIDLLAGYKRAANILKKEEGSWTPDQVRGDDVAAEEQALVDALDLAQPKAAAAIEKEDFTAAMTALASLRAPIDAFFEAVTVNADDRGVRARRLTLLARFRDAVNAVADFSKIEG